jgi:hypothetical protein
MKFHVIWKAGIAGVTAMAAERQARREAGDARFVDDYLAYLLAAASHAVSSQFHQQVREAGLGVLEWRVLASLAEGDGRPMSEVARLVLAKQPTLTKLIDRMAAAAGASRPVQDRPPAMPSVYHHGRAPAGHAVARGREAARGGHTRHPGR